MHKLTLLYGQNRAYIVLSTFRHLMYNQDSLACQTPPIDEEKGVREMSTGFHVSPQTFVWCQSEVVNELKSHIVYTGQER